MINLMAVAPARKNSQPIIASVGVLRKNSTPINAVDPSKPRNHSHQAMVERRACAPTVGAFP